MVAFKILLLFATLSIIIKDVVAVEIIEIKNLEDGKMRDAYAHPPPPPPSHPHRPPSLPSPPSHGYHHPPPSHNHQHRSAYVPAPPPSHYHHSPPPPPTVHHHLPPPSPPKYYHHLPPPPPPTYHHSPPPKPGYHGRDADMENPKGRSAIIVHHYHGVGYHVPGYVGGYHYGGGIYG